MAILDTDLLLISRSSTNYKVQASELKDYIGSGVSILSPKDNETLGETTVTFTSTKFVETSSVSHISSTWKISLSTDTNFVSPVKQVSSSAANKTLWHVVGLEKNKTYIAKVTYNLSDSSSIDSQVITFSTTSTASQFIFGPPAAIAFNGYATGTANLGSFLNPGIPFVSFRTSSLQTVYVAAGLDGQLYEVDIPDFATTQQYGAPTLHPSNILTSGEKCRDVLYYYNRGNFTYVNQDGLLKNKGTPQVTIPAELLTTKIKSITVIDSWGNQLIRDDNNSLWTFGAFYSSSSSGNSGVLIGLRGINKIWDGTTSTSSYITLPANEYPIKVINYYGTSTTNAALWLTNLGNLYSTSPLLGGISNVSYTGQCSGATRTSPKRVLPYNGGIFDSSVAWNWTDIFPGSIGLFGGAVDYLYTWGWVGIADNKCRGGYGAYGNYNFGGSKYAVDNLSYTSSGWFNNENIVSVHSGVYNSVANTSGTSPLFGITSSGDIYYGSTYQTSSTVNWYNPNMIKYGIHMYGSAPIHRIYGTMVQMPLCTVQPEN